MMCCNHCFILALARWVSLREAHGLAWAKSPSLGENVAFFVLRMLFELVCLLFQNSRNYMLVVVMFWLEGLSP